MKTFNIDDVLAYYNKGNVIVLFSNTQTFLASNKSVTKESLLELLNSGKVIKGRIVSTNSAYS